MLTEDLALKSLNELKDILGERLTQDKYDYLKVGCKRAKKKYQVEGGKRYNIRGFHEMGQKGVKMFQNHPHKKFRNIWRKNNKKHVTSKDLFKTYQNQKRRNKSH